MQTEWKRVLGLVNVEPPSRLGVVLLEDDPGKHGIKVISSDQKERKVRRDLNKDKCAWNLFLENQPNYASMKNRC